MLPPWGARRTLEEAEGIDEVKCNAKTQNAKRYFIKTLLFLSCRTGLVDVSVTCPLDNSFFNFPNLFRCHRKHIIFWIVIYHIYMLC